MPLILIAHQSKILLEIVGFFCEIIFLIYLFIGATTYPRNSFTELLNVEKSVTLN